MENSVGLTIEKIKLQEQDKELKLKEKRELESTLNTLNRAIKETTTQIAKYGHEYSDLINNTDNLQAKLEVQQIRKHAFIEQEKHFRQELHKLKNKTDDGISKVWELRSSLCKAVQNVSDDCDIWALLIKPSCSSEPIPGPARASKAEDGPPALKNNFNVLKDAIQRRDIAMAERNKLIAEPDTGEEFLRIKNALRYSLEKSANKLVSIRCYFC